jgi:hypothetical protein
MNATVDSFKSIVVKEGIVLNLGGFDSLLAYLKKWCIQLWDLAFPVVFKGVSPLKKSNVFSNYCRVTLLV